MKNQIVRFCTNSINLYKISWFSTTIKNTTDHTNIHKQSANKTEINSIDPDLEQSYAYGHFFPKQWSIQKIYKVLDPSKRNIQNIQIIKNKVGQPTGKIMLKFLSQKSLNKYIAKYSEDYVITDEETQRIVILPFQLKTLDQQYQKRKDLFLEFPVRISNLDFDISESELKKLADDYGKVTHIDMSMRQSGINRGFATVYFQTQSQALSFIKFIGELRYKDRKLSAHFIEKSKKTWKQQAEQLYLDMPTYTFKANEELMRKLIKTKASSKAIEKL